MNKEYCVPLLLWNIAVFQLNDSKERVHKKGESIVSKDSQKTICLFPESFKVPQTLLTLGLECLWHIYRYKDSFEISRRAPKPGQKKASINKQIKMWISLTYQQSYFIKKKIGWFFLSRKKYQTWGGGPNEVWWETIFFTFLCTLP